MKVCSIFNETKLKSSRRVKITNKNTLYRNMFFPREIVLLLEMLIKWYGIDKKYEKIKEKESPHL